MAKTIKTTFKFRRGLAATFTANNTLLAEGEPAFELDTRKLKIGDGITRWNDLPYISDDISNSINTINKEKIQELFNKEEIINGI